MHTGKYLSLDGVYFSSDVLSLCCQVGCPENSTALDLCYLEIDNVALLQEVALVCQAGDAVGVGLWSLPFFHCTKHDVKH